MDRSTAPPDHDEQVGPRAAAVTDRGLVHHRNEDAYFVRDVPGAGAVAVVCDGVSASAVPHLAAHAGARAAGEALSDGLVEGGQRLDVVVGALEAAQRAVAEVATTEPEAAAEDGAPACTIVCAAWDGQSVTVGWVGDSRAYWLAGGEAVPLTVDHSWAQERVRAGTMTASQATNHPFAHVLTRWLGSDAPERRQQITTLRPPTPGRLLLCSDGLWNYAPDAAELAALIASVPSEAAVDLARSLVDAAIAAGGHDNVTVAVIEVDAGVEP